MPKASKTQARTDKSGTETTEAIKAKEARVTDYKEITNGNNQETDRIKGQTSNQTEALDSKVESKLAKAGKRSAKSIKEAEEKKAKETRKVSAKSDEQTDEKPKRVVKPARSRLERRSKGYRKSAELIEKRKQYTIMEAAELAKKTSTVKFDASVELHVRLDVDPKQADQNIRGSVVLPAGTGKTQRIAVFAEGDAVAEAKKAGADIAGGDEFLQSLDAGKIDFDILIATPNVMAKLGKYARLLGPKGLMPNPKSGTVTPNVTKAVSEAKAGRVEYRVDSAGIVHVPVGKVSFEAAKLVQNIKAITDSINSAKPANIKGTYVKSAFVTTTMGASIPLSNDQI